MALDTQTLELADMVEQFLNRETLESVLGYENASRLTDDDLENFGYIVQEYFFKKVSYAETRENVADGSVSVISLFLAKEYLNIIPYKGLTIMEDTGEITTIEDEHGQTLDLDHFFNDANDAKLWIDLNLD